ncbi:MAG TPA: hypothetical protein VEL76_02550 [Gemmataceae bacterium]|nr:hypothetical protein [Gemmataceae bacterium]
MSCSWLAVWDWLLSWEKVALLLPWPAKVTLLKDHWPLLRLPAS